MDKFGGKSQRKGFPSARMMVQDWNGCERSGIVDSVGRVRARIRNINLGHRGTRITGSVQQEGIDNSWNRIQIGGSSSSSGKDALLLQEESDFGGMGEYIR